MSTSTPAESGNKNLVHPGKRRLDLFPVQTGLDGNGRGFHAIVDRRCTTPLAGYILPLIPMSFIHRNFISEPKGE